MELPAAPAFWLGMALCDNQSAPEFTHAPCTPDSDTNIFDGTEPGRPRLHRQASRDRVPRAAVLPAGLGAVAAGRELRRDAVVRRDGDLQPQPGSEHRHAEQRRLPGTVGLEPANFAFITKSGVRTRRPARSAPTNASFTPTPSTDLFMGSGDQLTSTSTTAPAGLTAIVHDLTTGQTGR